MKQILITFLLLLSTIFFISCEEECCNDDLDNNSTGISGEWHFIMNADVDYNDTTMIKNMTEADFESMGTNVEDVFLYEDSRGNIIGFCHPFKFEGTRNEKTVTIKVYDHPDGEYDESRTVDNMTHISTMNLMIDEFGNMFGSGTYEPDAETEGIENNTYTITANRIGDVSYNDFLPDNPKGAYVNSSLMKKICDKVWQLDATIIGYLDGNKYRPIGNCGLQKDGGGYYIFGHEGPGNILPIYTSTIYYPVEWSFCDVRKYGFNLKLKGEAQSIETLRWIVEHEPPYANFYGGIGFAELNTLVEAIDSFEEKFGGFAISLAYDMETRNTGLYVNHTKGSSSEVREHSLINTIESHIGNLSGYRVGELFFEAGYDISDHWHLRRSTFLVCNTPLVVFYLLGTHTVYYD